jgi:predicted RNA-binding protein with RPS1 domain
MGGKAAKERRRLQRLAAQPSNDGGPKNDQHATAAKQFQTKAQKRFDNPKSTSPSSRVPPHDGRFTANRARFTKDHSKKVAPEQIKAKKTKLFKKPKHLKRKIESISQDEQEREKLLQKLKQWEESKLVKHQKKQKTTNSPSPKTEEPKKRETPQPVDTQRNVEDATPHESNDNENQSLSKKEAKKTDTTTPPPDDIQSDREDEEVTSTAQTTNPVFVIDEKKPLIPKEEDEASSDSESDISLEDTAQARQRGRRRRGRQSTEQHTEELDKTKELAPIIKNANLKAKEPSSMENQLGNEDHTKEVVKITSKKDDKRRCIGRKPVTDFLIGRRYPGKVIYTKSFGAFIDIGCHSDAFCHVSRVRDEFVKSIGDALTIGDEVSARVVEVDRSGKRITVSLQSDARVEDEHKSIEARMQRKKKMKKSKNDVENITSPVKREPIEEEPSLNETMMTPAEIKRARKLARRVARREQQNETGITA